MVHRDHIIGPWVCQRTGGSYSPHNSKTIGMMEGPNVVAGVIFDNYNGRSVRMHVAGEGNWLTREYLWVCFDYVFRQLGVRKVLGEVDSTNQKALNFDRKLGFVHEYTIKDAGKCEDLHIMSMAREQCRWLKLGDKYGREK